MNDTDVLARLLSCIGLFVAIAVAIIQFLNFRRNRHTNPKLKIRRSTDLDLLLNNSSLLVVKAYIDNCSYTPNTVVKIACYKTHLPGILAPLGKEYFQIGNLSLHTNKNGIISLNIKPDLILQDNDWEKLITGSGQILQEGLWHLPMYIRAVTSEPIVFAITC